jgi:spermidine/putrescine transport system ATP-binding protein
MVAGFEWPTEGEIYIDGVVQGHTPPFNRSVNTVFQNYALFQHMTVAQNIAFGLEMEKTPAAEINKRMSAILEMVQMKGMDRRFPRQLSGGQQQRVALARALVKLPKVLLLDEPLGALDLKLRKEMQLELKAIQQKVGITFIYVTHDQQEALTMSDRIAVMSRGRVLQIGNPVEIYERPTSRFVADFIGESNFFEGVIQTTENDHAIVEVPSLKGALQGINKGGRRKGDKVIVSIRPEKIRIFEQASATENFFVGTVKSTTYIGSDTHVYVDLNGLTLKVWEQNKISNLDPKSYYVQGQKIYLHLVPENTLVLSES